jgi:hypothetical protein
MSRCLFMVVEAARDTICYDLRQKVTHLPPHEPPKCMLAIERLQIISPLTPAVESLPPARSALTGLPLRRISRAASGQTDQVQVLKAHLLLEVAIQFSEECS